MGESSCFLLHLFLFFNVEQLLILLDRRNKHMRQQRTWILAWTSRRTYIPCCSRAMHDLVASRVVRFCCRLRLGSSTTAPRHDHDTRLDTLTTILVAQTQPLRRPGRSGARGNHATFLSAHTIFFVLRNLSADFLSTRTSPKLDCFTHE